VTDAQPQAWMNQERPTEGERLMAATDNWPELASDHPTSTVRNFFYDCDIRRHCNLNIPPMDMTQQGAADEKRPVIGWFELDPDEPLILDLINMSFRTFLFEGAIRVLRYVEWMLGSDMRETYAFHRDVEIDPNAKFVWTHRDPPKSVDRCAVSSPYYSWSGGRGASNGRWTSGKRPIQRTPSPEALHSFGLRSAMRRGASAQDWADGHKPGHRGTLTYDLADYGLTPAHVREAFGSYLGTYDASA
jgi:hypothetical protein